MMFKVSHPQQHPDRGRTESRLRSAILPIQMTAARVSVCVVFPMVHWEKEEAESGQEMVARYDLGETNWKKYSSIEEVGYPAGGVWVQRSRQADYHNKKMNY